MNRRRLTSSQRSFETTAATNANAQNEVQKTCGLNDSVGTIQSTFRSRALEAYNSSRGARVWRGRKRKTCRQLDPTIDVEGGRGAFPFLRRVPCFRCLFFSDLWVFLSGFIVCRKSRWNSVLVFYRTLKFGFYWGLHPSGNTYFSVFCGHVCQVGFYRALVIFTWDKMFKITFVISFLQKNCSGFTVFTDMEDNLYGLFFGGYQ